MAELRFPPILVTVKLTAEVVRETVHRCPPNGSGIMPCCGRTPFEVLRDRITVDPMLVTCRVRAARRDGAE